MKIKLSNKEIAKLIATLSLEEIQSHLGYNWSYWEIPSYIGDEIELNEKKTSK